MFIALQVTIKQTEAEVIQEATQPEEAEVRAPKEEEAVAGS